MGGGKEVKEKQKYRKTVGLTGRQIQTVRVRKRDLWREGWGRKEKDVSERKDGKR